MQHSNIVKYVLISTIIATIARFIQVFKFTESITGFSINEKGALWGQTIMFIIIIASIIVSLVITSSFSKRQPVRPPKLDKAPKFAIMGYICSVTMALNGVLMLISAAVSVTTLLGALLYLISAVSIALYSTTALKKFQMPHIIMIAPVILFIYLLIEKFMSFNGVTTIIENIFTVIYLSLQLLFFLVHGKLISSVSIRKSSRQILIISALAFMFSAMCSVPNVLVTLLGKGELVHEGALNISFLVYGIYSFLYSSVVYAKRQMPSSGVASVRKLDVAESQDTDTNFLIPNDDIH